ncbi:MAG: hypothetical protein ACI9VR_005314 [Cognaticolwellia sp.]|jgi:hypothetical protein
MKKLITLLALTIPLTACEPIEQACTDDLRVSVSVEVVDEAGADVLDAVVQFDAGSGPEDCQSYDGVHSCGMEIDGELDILVSAPDFEDQIVSVIVERDACHVISQDLVVDLLQLAP